VSAVFVGRQGVLDALRVKLADAFDGRGSVVMLAGEAGIGKTAVADRFAALARDRGAVVLSGSCLEGGWQPPYAPWVEALDDCAAIAHPRRLGDLLGGSASPLVQLVPRLASMLPDAPPPARLPPDEARVRLYDAVSRLLTEIAAETPVVVVLDDLHWADADTIGLLRYVARVSTRSPLLILGAYRDPGTGSENRQLAAELLAVVRREADFLRIGISGLRALEVTELLTAMAGVAVPPGLAQTIRDETAGNPFFVREVFHQLVEDGRIVPGADTWSAAGAVGDLGIPPGVRDVLARRMSRLSAEAKEVLGIACALSGGFEFPLLVATTGLSEAGLLDAIDELLAAGLIRAAGEHRPGYDFSHAIVRHVLIDALNPDRRARVQRQIAHALEGPPGHGRDRAAELAYQYHASRSLPGARAGIPYCRAAADEAAAAYAPEQAARLLRMAADLAADAEPAERADIHCALAVAEGEALLLDASRASVEVAIAALAESGAGQDATAAFLARV
jgi:predicted ATPase